MAPKNLMSEEDIALKQKIEMYMGMIQGKKPELHKTALESLREIIKSGTSSLMSVPTAVKFLRRHYGKLKECYEKMLDPHQKKILADVLSVLALTMSDEGKRESLTYRLLGSDGDISPWGHPYIRNLTEEIQQEWEIRESKDASIDDLLQLVKQILAFHMQNNTEHEGVDLLVEVGVVNLLEEHVEKTNFERTCSYLINLVKYLSRSEYESAMEIVFRIYMKFQEFPRALRIALSINNMQYVKQIFITCNDFLLKKQLSFILARQGIRFELDEEMCEDAVGRKAIEEIINNRRLSDSYLAVAWALDVMETKFLKDIYKTCLRHGLESNDSAQLDLAAVFALAFVNAGFFPDGLTRHGFVFKDVEKYEKHERISVAASLGVLHLWDCISDFHQIDEIFGPRSRIYEPGSKLAACIMRCGVKSEYDRVLECIIQDARNWNSISISTIMGLGLAYAGDQDEQIRSILLPILHRESLLDVIAFTAVSLGLVYVGSSDIEISEAIMVSLMKQSESELGKPLARLLPLSLGLLHLGKQEALEDAAASLKSFNEKIQKHFEMILLSCAHVGTGDVLVVQKLLRQLQIHPERDEAFQGPAVLGIAMVAIAEEVGLNMTQRTLEHLLTYGSQSVRKAVPLALSLLFMSDPQVTVTNLLYKLSGDPDKEVAMAAVISLGLIGAGTNDTSIAEMLCELSTLYCDKGDLLFCVRIAVGLVYLGKGLITLAPYHSERFLLSPAAAAGLITLLHFLLDTKSLILEQHSYALYYLVLSMHPRMLMTVDRELKPLPVTVQVGNVVDTTCKPGNPRSITNFNTFETPIILSTGQKAVLANEEYVPMTPFLEGFVILRENP